MGVASAAICTSRRRSRTPSAPNFPAAVVPCARPSLPAAILPPPIRRRASPAAVAAGPGVDVRRLAGPVKGVLHSASTADRRRRRTFAPRFGEFAPIGPHRDTRASAAAHQPAFPLTGRRAVDRRRQCGPASAAIRATSSGARPCSGPQPPSHGSSCVDAEHPAAASAAVGAAVPGARLGVIEGQAHDRLDPPPVPGQPIAQLVAEAREDLQVIHRPRAVGRAQREHPAGPEEHERDPLRPDQHVALDHPAAGAPRARGRRAPPPRPAAGCGPAPRPAGRSRPARAARARRRRRGAGARQGTRRRRAVGGRAVRRVRDRACRTHAQRQAATTSSAPAPISAAIAGAGSQWLEMQIEEGHDATGDGWLARAHRATLTPLRTSIVRARATIRPACRRFGAEKLRSRHSSARTRHSLARRAGRREASRPSATPLPRCARS